MKTRSVATLMVAKFNKKYKIWKYKVDAYYILCYYDFEICICACKTGKKFGSEKPERKYEELVPAFCEKLGHLDETF